MVLRNLIARHEPLVVDEHCGLVGRAVGLVLVDRPRGQLRRFRRRIAHRLPVVDQLHLKIHRRAPHHVGRALTRCHFGDEAVIHFGRVHVVVLDLDVRIQRAEILDQRSRGLGVERAVDDDLAFLVRCGDGLRVVRGITGGHVLRERGTTGEGERKPGKLRMHGISSWSGPLRPWCGNYRPAEGLAIAPRRRSTSSRSVSHCWCVCDAITEVPMIGGSQIVGT